MDFAKPTHYLKVQSVSLLAMASRFKRKNSQAILAYCILAPDLIGIFIFVVFPILMAFYMSFTDWSGLNKPSFVGLTNYIEMFSDELWQQSIKVTLTYVAVMIPATTVIPLLLAVFVNSKNYKFKNLFRTTFFSPFMLPLIVVSVTWKFIFDPLGGFLNLALRTLQLSPLEWLGSVNTALLCIMIVNIWWSAGYYMILFIAGLNDIPSEYFDAAAIDGASGVQSFFRITLPLLRPTLTFVLVILTIDTFQIFDMVYVMTGGGPAQATFVNVFYIYRRAFEFFEFGYSSAIAFFLCLVIFLVSYLILRMMNTGRID